MIIESVTLGKLLIGLGAAVIVDIHNIFKGKAAAQEERIKLQQEYCPPAITLPNDTPPWKFKQYKEDCKGIHKYLEQETPELLQIAPTQTSDPSVGIGPVAPDAGAPAK